MLFKYFDVYFDIFWNYIIYFLPRVVEMIGVWALEAAKALSRIDRASALHGFGAGSATLLQEACVVARSWRACVALRRRAELQP